MNRNLIPCFHFWRERHKYNRNWRDAKNKPWRDARHCAICCLAEDLRGAGDARWKAWRLARDMANPKNLIPVDRVRTIKGENDNRS